MATFPSEKGQTEKAQEVSAACQKKQCPVLLEQDIGYATTRLGKNVCYIAGGLAIRDDKILLIQEGMPSCRGTWYLPCGRVDPNETIEHAAVRETLEESGHEVETLALIAVEFESTEWMRFSFAVRVTGGALKRVEDGESMQSRWWSADQKKLCKEVQLRSTDCLEAISLARKWHQLPEENRCKGGFISAGHISSMLRLLVVHHCDDTTEVMVRRESARGSYLPSCFLHGQESVTHIIDQTAKAAGYTRHYKVIGVLSVEHLGQPARRCDGVLLTVLIKTDSRILADGSPCQWEKLDGEDQSILTNILKSPYGCAKLLEYT